MKNETTKNKVFISGAISSDPDYHQKFRDAALILVKQGYTVMNPAILPHGFEQDEYLHVCYAMIDICDTVCFLPDWNVSPGAMKEMSYAKGTVKNIAFLCGRLIVLEREAVK